MTTRWEPPELEEDRKPQEVQEKLMLREEVALNHARIVLGQPLPTWDSLNDLQQQLYLDSADKERKIYLEHDYRKKRPFKSASLYPPVPSAINSKGDKAKR